MEVTLNFVGCGGLRQVGVRSGIVLASSAALGKALTIAIRYSAQRRQFGPKGGPETQVLDYTSLQFRLLPLLASAYAFHFTGRHMVLLLAQLLSGMSQGDLSALPVVHASSAGLKSLITGLVMNVSCIEIPLAGGWRANLASVLCCRASTCAGRVAAGTATVD